ncbi:MAG: hypothetical protein JRJ06_06570 [Deltaproteobacteria bacterium]|nr:hypothetical protein [Deltaproteobacteria bacterium]
MRIRAFIVLISLIAICIFYVPSVMAEDLTIVATDEAYQEAQGWVDFLRAKEIPLTHVTPQEFAKGSEAKYIVLMGGMDEPEGIRDIAQAFKKYIMPKNAKGPQMWGATVNHIIFTGTDLAAAVKARKNSKDMWWEELSVWFDIDESPAMHPY